MVNLKIGQKRVHKPEFVDEALKAIGHNSGHMSPLVPMAVDPTLRDKVQAMAYDGAWQMVRAPDPATSDKWYRFARTCQVVLRHTKRTCRANARRSAR